MAQFRVRYEPSDLRARFTPQAFRDVLLRVIPEAFEPVRSATQSAAPRKSGKLAGNVVVRIGRGVTLVVRIVMGAGYAWNVEHGHNLVSGGKLARTHTLGAVLGRILSGTRVGSIVGRVPPHPYGEPVYRRLESRVTATIEQALLAAVER